VSISVSKLDSGFIAWPIAPFWEGFRDTLVIAYVFLRFHSKLIEALGLTLWPPIAGGRPVIVKPEFIVYFLLFWGVWRLIADPEWRTRFAIPYGKLQIAAAFGLIAMLAWNSVQAKQLSQALVVLDPLLLFSVGIITGVTRRRIINSVIFMAVLNIMVTIITSAFFMNLFRDWILILNTLVQSADLTAWRASKNPYISTGLIVYFVYFNMLIMTVFAVSINNLLFGKNSKFAYYINVFVSVSALVLAFMSLSRGTMATCLIVLMLQFYAWIRHRISEGQTSARQAIRLTVQVIVLAVCLVLILRIGIKTILPHRDIFNTTTFVSEEFEVGRTGVWENVIEDITRKGGWLTGVTQIQLDGFDAPRVLRFGEERYFTTDNLYLAIIVRCGLIGLLFKLLFTGITYMQLYRARAYMELSVLIGSAIVWEMLISEVMLQSIFILIGASLLGDLATTKAFASEHKLDSRTIYSLSKNAGRA
jgi:hypothetical protein